MNRLSFAWLGIWWITFRGLAGEPAAVEWFRPPSQARLQLTADGNRVGALTSANGRTAWEVLDLAADGTRKAARVMPGSEVTDFAWTGNGTAVLQGRDVSGNPSGWTTGAPDWRAEPLPPADAGIRLLRLLRPQPRPESAVLAEGFLRRSGNARWPDVFAWPPAGGPPTRVARNPGDVGEWLVDSSGRARLALAIHGRTQELRIAPEAAGEAWRTVMTFDFIRDPARLLGISADGQWAWLAARLGRDTRGVYEFDLRAGRVSRARWTDPDFDFGDGIVWNGGDLVAVNFDAERPATTWLAADWAAAVKGRPGWRPEAVSTDGRRGLFLEARDRQPARGWWFNRESETMSEVFPAMLENQVEGAVMQPVQWTARDGVGLRGYLTRPPLAGGTRPPLVVLVHGGPWTRDTWGWQPEVQFLAARGWAVLQVNYRGSAGFGLAFQERGAGRWPEAADDLADGARWAVAEGLADGERLAVAGASFGGFLAALALTRDGQPFQAAASLGGVFDLRAWLQESRQREAEFVVDAQREWLFGTAHAAGSPAAVPAAAVRRPLLLVHARDDARVSFEQSERFAERLRQLGRPVELMVLPAGGHALGTAEQQAAVWEQVEAFLRRGERGKEK